MTVHEPDLTHRMASADDWKVISAFTATSSVHTRQVHGLDGQFNVYWTCKACLVISALNAAVMKV